MHGLRKFVYIGARKFNFSSREICLIYRFYTAFEHLFPPAPRDYLNSLAAKAA